MLNLFLLSGIVTLPLLLIFNYLMIVELQYHQALRCSPKVKAKRQYKTVTDMEYMIPFLFIGCIPIINLFIFIFLIVCYVDSLNRLSREKKK